jgi:hypothetical protein
VKRAVITLLVLLLTLPLFSTQKTMITKGELGDLYYSMKSTVTYSNPAGGGKTWYFTEDDRTIGLFMNNSWQNVELKNATYSLDDVKNDEDGNKIGLLELPQHRLLPGENLSITTEYEIVARPRSIPDISENASGVLDEIPNYLVQAYANAEGPWALHDPRLKNLAHEIAGNESKVLTIVQESIVWIKENIIYGTHEIPLYANQTLSTGIGDCDDQAILLIALLRIVGIPSYLQIGAIYMPEYPEVHQDQWDNHVQTIERKLGWHGWAIAYVPPWGWLPIDLTFVRRGFRDPLNAIRYGAVTEQNTVQYMNISRADYIADSDEAKSFLTENGFLVYVEDEMTQVSRSEGVTGFNPAVTAIIAVAVIVVAFFAVFLIIRLQRKRPEEQKSL